MPAGSGKTMVLEAMASKLNGVYVYCDPTLTARELLARITGGARHQHNTAQRLQAAVSMFRSTDRPIFLDEAHTLPPGCFPVIRSLHDQARVPIIMAGAAEILHCVDDASLGGGQMASRCLTYNALERTLDTESHDPHHQGGRPLYSIEEVQALSENWCVRLVDGGLQIGLGAGLPGPLRHHPHRAAPSCSSRC